MTSIYIRETISLIDFREKFLASQESGRLAVERAEARSATMADSEKNCDFGHARGDIA